MLFTIFFYRSCQHTQEFCVIKSPKPPEPPDPYKTANAQQLSDIGVAEANTALLNANEDTPQANMTFEQIEPVTITTYQYDGNGNLTGTTPRQIKRWKKVLTLKPRQQALFDQQEELSLQFNDWALNQIRQLREIMIDPLSATGLVDRLATPSGAQISTSIEAPGPLVESIGSSDLVQHLQNTSDAINFRVEYQIGLDRDKMIASLDLQGIMPGSRAYERALNSFSFQSNDARQQSYLAAQGEQTRIINLEAFIAQFANEVQNMRFSQSITFVQAVNGFEVQKWQSAVDLCNYVNVLRQMQLQEQITIRSQTVNETSALAQGGQVQVPQFQPYQGAQMQQSQLGDFVYRTAAMKQQNYQMKVQQQQQMLGGILGFAGNMIGGGMALGFGR